MLQARYLLTILGRGALSPSIPCSAPLSYPCQGPFPGMTSHPLSSLTPYPNGPIQQEISQLQTVRTSSSDHHTSAETLFPVSNLPLQPHLDVFHSASDHGSPRTILKYVLLSLFSVLVLISTDLAHSHISAYFPARLQTPSRQGRSLVLLFVSPKRHSTVLDTEII